MWITQSNYKRKLDNEPTLLEKEEIHEMWILQENNLPEGYLHMVLGLETVDFF
jgi:hypothetical protein